MSKDVDRNQVFQSIKVRTSLKNDLSWMQKASQDNKDDTRTDQDVGTRPAPVRQNSYVLSTVKKFESADSPLSPPLQNTQLIPSGPQAPTEELTQLGEAQPEKSVVTTTAEDKDECAAATLDQSNIEPNEGAAEVSANVDVEEPIQNGEAQPVSSTKENPGAVAPVETSEQPAANTTAENKGEYADTALDQSNVESNEVKVFADAHVEGPVADTSAAADTQESGDSAEVPAAIEVKLRPQHSVEAVPDLVAASVCKSSTQSVADTATQGSCEKDSLEVKLRPQEEPSAKTEAANAANLEDAGVLSTVEPGEKSCEKCPPVQAAEDIVEAVAEVNVASPSPESPAVTDAAAGDTVLQHSVEAVPDIVAASVCNSSTQLAAETATEGSCEKESPEIKLRPQEEPSTKAEVENATNLEDTRVQSTIEPEENICEKCPPVQAAEDIVEAVAEVNVMSPPPESPAVTDAAAGEAVLQHSVEAAPDSVGGTVSESPTQPAAETAVKSVECKVDSATVAEPVLQIRAAEVVECEVQPADIAVVEQSVEPTPEDAAGRVVELCIEDALEPVTASDCEVVAEETELNQQSDHIDTSETFQKPSEEEKSTQPLIETRSAKDVCSICDIKLGNVKIILSEPLINCHPECLKCGVCTKDLGDFLTPIFLHDQEIQCGCCFAKALKT